MKTQDEILQEISRKLGEITPQVETLSQAKQAGMTMTGQTTVEEAERFLSSPRIQDPDTTNESALSILDKITPESRLAELELQRQKDTERLQSEIAEAKEERRTWTERASDFLTGRKAQPIIEEKQEEFKVKEYMDTASASLSQALELQRKAINLEAQKEGALAAVAASGITTPYLSKEQARIAEAYDRRISSLAALAGAESAYAQAVQGQISQARALIGDIVNAYTYDTNLELQRINMFIELNSAELAELGAEYQNALNESQRYWENKLAEEKNERTNVLEFMLNYTDAGITLDDSLEEAAQKVAAYLKIQPNATTMEIMAQYPQAFAGLTKEQLQKMTPLEALMRIGSMPGTPTKLEFKTLDDGSLVALDPYTGNVVSTISEGDPYKGLIAQATLNNLAAAGVPEEEALRIQYNLNNGYTYEEMIQSAIDSGEDYMKIAEYIDKFAFYKKNEGALYISTDVKIGNEYRKQAELLKADSDKGSEPIKGQQDMFIDSPFFRWLARIKEKNK